MRDVFSQSIAKHERTIAICMDWQENTPDWVPDAQLAFLDEAISALEREAEESINKLQRGIDECDRALAGA